MHKYNLKLENIKRHYDFAPDKKVCPNYMIVTGRWLEFLDLINIEYMALEYLQNATITWSVTTKDNDNTENVLNQYFTYASNNLWIAKPVHEPVELTIKVKVEKDLCIGCGACQAICPDVFKIGDDRLSSVIVDHIEDVFKDDVIEAVESCPTEAIKKED